MNEYRVTVEFTVRENNDLDAVDSAHYLVWSGIHSLRREGWQSDIRVIKVNPA